MRVKLDYCCPASALRMWSFMSILQRVTRQHCRRRWSQAEEYFDLFITSPLGGQRLPLLYIRLLKSMGWILFPALCLGAHVGGTTRLLTWWQKGKVKDCHQAMASIQRERYQNITSWKGTLNVPVLTQRLLSTSSLYWHRIGTWSLSKDLQCTAQLNKRPETSRNGCSRPRGFASGSDVTETLPIMHIFIPSTTFPKLSRRTCRSLSTRW